MIEVNYTYKAHCNNVVDGDTIDCTVDLGFMVAHAMRLRLLGVDAHELNSKDEKQRELARQAKFFVESLVFNKEIIIQTKKSDSFGRWLADVWIEGKNLNKELVLAGLAIEWRR